MLVPTLLMSVRSDELDILVSIQFPYCIAISCLLIQVFLQVSVRIRDFGTSMMSRKDMDSKATTLS